MIAEAASIWSATAAVNLTERTVLADGETANHSATDIVWQLDSSYLAAIVGVAGVNAYTAVALGVGDQADITLTQAAGDLGRTKYTSADGDVLVNGDAFSDLAELNRDAALGVAVQEFGHTFGIGELGTKAGAAGTLTASVEDWGSHSRDDLSDLVIDAGVDAAQLEAFAALYGASPAPVQSRIAPLTVDSLVDLGDGLTQVAGGVSPTGAAAAAVVAYAPETLEPAVMPEPFRVMQAQAPVPLDAAELIGAGFTVDLAALEAFEPLDPDAGPLLTLAVPDADVFAFAGALVSGDAVVFASDADASSLVEAFVSAQGACVDPGDSGFAQADGASSAIVEYIPPPPPEQDDLAIAA